jgi:hypothetical protein
VRTAPKGDLQAMIGEYFALSAKYGPMLLQANEQIAREFPDNGSGPANPKSNARREALLRDRGALALGDEIDQLHDKIGRKSAAILRKKITGNVGPDDFRERVLVALYEMRPSMYDHEGVLDFPDDGGATRALFDAAAAFSGLSPFIAEIEALLTAECRARKGGAA